MSNLSVKSISLLPQVEQFVVVVYTRNGAIFRKEVFDYMRHAETFAAFQRSTCHECEIYRIRVDLVKSYEV